MKSLLLSKPSLDSLTAAETSVVKLIAEDRTSKEIAELLKFAFDHKSYL
ncbi:MAG: hypothetical protein ABIS50_00960 [Luteolibacter sp.]